MVGKKISGCSQGGNRQQAFGGVTILVLIRPSDRASTLASATRLPRGSSPANDAADTTLLPTDSARPADVVEPPWSNVQARAGKLTRQPDGTLSVDTVRWAFKEEGPSNEWSGIFADATIDPRRVKNVYLGLKPFSVKSLVAHSVLVFEMDESHPVKNSQGGQDSAIVLSMEAKLAQGEEYSMRKTLSGKYGVVYQLQTWTDLMQKTGRREGLNQLLYKLDLNAEQKEQLVQNALAAATAPRQDDRYHLFTNSCHSAAIDLVSSAVEDKRQISRWLLPKVYNPLALFPAHGDVLFHGHQLLAHHDRLVVQPDQELHPGKLLKQGPLAESLRQASSSPFWTPACVATGAVGGALAGLAVSQLPQLLTVPLMAGVGAGLGKLFADTTEVRTHSSFISNEEAIRMSPSEAFAASRKSAT